MSGWGSGGTSSSSGWGSGGTGGGGGGWGTSNNNNNSGNKSGGGWGTSNTGGSGGGSGGWGTSGNNNNSNNNNNNQQQQQQQQEVNPYLDFSGHLVAMGASLTGQHLARFDACYNAAHPSCQFRAMLVNMCPAGQSYSCVAREKAKWRQWGGGPSNEAWSAAELELPQPRDSYYPYAYHFAFALQERQAKQMGELENFHRHMGSLRNKQTTLRESQAKNEERLRKIASQEGLHERKLLLAMARAEVLRRSGIRIGSTEEHEILQHVRVVRAAVGISAAAVGATAASGAPASASAFDGADPFSPLAAFEQQQQQQQQYNSYRAADTVENRIRRLRGVLESQGGAVGADMQDPLTQQLGTCVDTPTLRDWAKLLDAREDAIQRLQAVVQKDLRDLQAIRRK